MFDSTTNHIDRRLGQPDRWAVPARTRRWCWRAALGWLVLWSCCNDTLVAQQLAFAREYKVKVAYLYNFTRYVTWPESAFEDRNSPFVIGILGKDPFGPTLTALQQRKKAAGRAIEIQQFASAAEYQPTNILFVSRDSTARDRAEILQRTKGTAVLIVGESPNFASDGASLNFFFDKDGTVGFELNVDAVKRGGMRVDAKLLSIARVVRDRGL